MFPNSTGFRRFFRIAAWGLAALVAGAAVPAGERADDEADDKTSAAALPALTLPRMDVVERMWGKDSKKRFWKEARGGNDFQNLYEQFSSSLNRDGSGARKPCDEDAAYDPRAAKVVAVYHRPAGYKSADAKNWGIYLHLDEFSRQNTNEQKFWQGGLVEPGSEFAELFERHKLIYVTPILEGPRSDVYQLCMALDALKAAFNETPELETSKRIYVGGSGDGARVAGILAMNFARVGKKGFFSGYFPINNLAVRVSLKPITERNRSAAGAKYIRYGSTERLFDLPYIREQEWKTLAKAVRIVGFTNGDDLSSGHSAIVRGLFSYIQVGFKVRLFDLPETPLDAETMSQAIDWLDGKIIPPSSMIRTKSYNFVWPEKDK